jgi:kynurenine formamidase
MNTKIAPWEPMESRVHAIFQKKSAKNSTTVSLPSTSGDAHRTVLQPYEAIHAECVGGDIEKLSNKRCVIGIFPWKLVEGESCISRIVAFDGFDDV